MTEIIYNLCSNGQAYALLGQEAFIKFIVDTPRLRLYEVHYGGFRYYGISDLEKPKLPEEAMLVTSTLYRIRNIIMEGELYAYGKQGSD